MNNMDSGFDLNLDSEQFSSENLHSIEYWEEELDVVVNSQRAMLKSQAQKEEFDIMVSNILIELREDNDVLDQELRDLIDEIYFNLNEIKVQDVLLTIRSCSDRHELDELISDAVMMYPRFTKMILTEVVTSGDLYQQVVFDLFDRKDRNSQKADLREYFRSILFQSPEFVRSLFSLRKFFQISLQFDNANKGGPVYQNKILEIFSRDFHSLMEMHEMGGGPLLFSLEYKQSYGSPYRQVFMELLNQLESNNTLNDSNKRFIDNLKNQEFQRLEGFIDNPQEFVTDSGVYGFLSFVTMVSKKLSGQKLIIFKLKVLDAFDRPDFIIGIFHRLSGLTRKEFRTGNSIDYWRQSILDIIKLGIKKKRLSSKLYNVLARSLGDYSFLQKSRDNFEGGLLTEFDGLSQNEDWIEKRSWAKDGFNHVQAFSQIGSSLDRIVGNSNSKELVITYPASGDHTSLIETVARGFNNSNLNLESAVIKLTEVSYARGLIKHTLDQLSQGSDVVSDVGEFVEDLENPHLNVLNLKVLGKPVRIEFYLEAFDPTSRDDWYGYENLRASQMIVLHDLGSASLYSNSERKKIINFVQYITKHGLPQIDTDVNLNSERPQTIRRKASEDIISDSEFMEIVRSRDPEIDLNSIDQLLKDNPNGLTGRQNLDLYKTLRMSTNEIDNLEERLKSIMRFVVTENQSKVVVMDYVSFRKYKNEYLFIESGVSFDVIDADPGAIFGCDCNSLAHQGMVVLRLTPRRSE
jgi:hypothetical protein